MLKIKILFTLMLSIFSLNLMALTLDGYDFPEKINVDSQTLFLNGTGTRKATFLKIKVYNGALYLLSKTQNPNEFLDNYETKRIVMNFLRDVSVNDLQNTYIEAFKASNTDYESMSAEFRGFNAQFTHDIKKGQTLVFTFTKEGTTLTDHQGMTSKKLGDAKFSRALLRMWFINPKDSDLADGLLGK